MEELTPNQTPTPPPPPPPAASPAGPERQAHMWGMFCHLAGFAGLIVPFFGQILGPLVVWLIKKDEFAFVNDQGKEAVNFQISMAIYMLVASMLSLILIGIPILIGLGIADIVLVIIATIKANDGFQYRYPITIRFLK
jgi:uncharacterized protein